MNDTSTPHDSPDKDRAGLFHRTQKLASKVLHLNPSQTSLTSKSRGRWENILAGILLIAALVCGLATYAALTETPPLGNDPDTVIWLLNLDLIILLVLSALIARRLVALFAGRRRGLAGSRLHVRLVYIFSALAVAPAIIMVVFSVFFFHFGVQAWFSERVRTAVNESQAVAQAYLEEHQKVIRADVLAMANDLDRQAGLFLGNQQAFDRVMQTQSVLRNLSEAIVFDSSGDVLARSGLTLSLEMEEIPDYALDQARRGDVVLLNSQDEDRIRALVKLNNFVDSYLFVGRRVDPDVISHLQSTKRAVQEYSDLQARYSGMQLTVTMIFVVVALLLLLAAIWFGLNFARQMANPISSLISASERVRAGDLTARVPEEEGLEEFEYLARSFNRMTNQLQGQRDEVMMANRQLDQRRRFTETVLAGVTSGIIGLTDTRDIRLANNAAAELLNVNSAADMAGHHLNDYLPEIEDLLAQALARPNRIHQSEIPVAREKSGRRILLVRIAIELVGEVEKGAVITLDDITELQSAQRKAAWADVARRIAHEIKNPLTPIQLSAERLKRRYLKQIPEEDQQIFAQCTDTIIHHVEDIGHMVNEFSAFARMPEPRFEQCDIVRIAQEAMFLQKEAHPGIQFTLRDQDSDGPVRMQCDPKQIRQALGNVIQNAIEAINNTTAGPEIGRIDLTLLRADEDNYMIIVSDNGPGLPEYEDPARLSEPYVTFREKGTGLGLAIVKKIMEDHDGDLIFDLSNWNLDMATVHRLSGACIALKLPLQQAAIMETSGGYTDQGAVSGKTGS